MPKKRSREVSASRRDVCRRGGRSKDRGRHADLVRDSESPIALEDVTLPPPKVLDEIIGEAVHLGKGGPKTAKAVETNGNALELRASESEVVTHGSEEKTIGKGLGGGALGYVELLEEGCRRGHRATKGDIVSVERENVEWVVEGGGSVHAVHTVIIKAFIEGVTLAVPLGPADAAPIPEWLDVTVTEIMVSLKG